MSAGPAGGGAPWWRFWSTGTITTDDRLTGNDPDCGPAAGDSLVVTTFGHLARSLSEAGAIAVELNSSAAALNLGDGHRAWLVPGTGAPGVHQRGQVCGTFWSRVAGTQTVWSGAGWV